MDNASKALIMAGAILIAVALVGVGVYLYQSAVGTVGTGVDQLAAASMETKNSMLEPFEGRIKGSELKQLLRKVNTYNEANVFPTALTVTGSDITSGSDGKYSTTGISNSKLYDVGLTYTDGYVNTITVSAAGATPATPATSSGPAPSST